MPAKLELKSPAAGPKTPPAMTGAVMIADKVRTLPLRPGVYRMISAKGTTLYVGKARALKKRVLAYTRPEKHPRRIARMISLAADMEFTLTGSESEALLLEAAMIKRFRPPFNIIMRDDKSFPYIALFTGHEAPRLAKHRGRQTAQGEYFGPFVSAGAVDKSLHALQRAFLLRTCSDSVYAARTRPCLLYQIKRCAAPCTGVVSLKDYAALASEAARFLKGESRAVQDALSARMEQASKNTRYEQAALYRDRLRALGQVQGEATKNKHSFASTADVFAIARKGGHVCVEVFIFRIGQNMGNRAYFPQSAEEDEGEILQSFIAQFYEGRKIPPLILVSADMPQTALLAEALAIKSGGKVEVLLPKRGRKRKAITQALANAEAAAARRFAETAEQEKMLAALASLLTLPSPPKRIEVYDNSHIQGANAIGAMICASATGFVKNRYRIFNIKQAAASDDYAMMREVFSRRFSRLVKESAKSGEYEETLPDLVIVDGGEGQRKAAAETLAALGCAAVPVLGVAKGKERNAGRETLFFAGQPAFTLNPKDPLLYYIQRLRDEAHRFAIARHRARRKKQTFINPLDGVDGIGAKRKQALLRRFGSAKAASAASPGELGQVEGINAKLAQTIYEHFHDETL